MGCLSVRMRGPLAVYQDAIWSALLGRGYTPLSAKNLLRVAAHLSRWLEAEGLCPLDLTPARIDSFLEHRVRCGYTCWRTSRGLEPILEPLRSLGVVPTGFTPEPDASPLGQLLQEYERYLEQDRDSRRLPRAPPGARLRNGTRAAPASPIRHVRATGRQPCNHDAARPRLG